MCCGALPNFEDTFDYQNTLLKDKFGITNAKKWEGVGYINKGFVNKGTC